MQFPEHHAKQREMSYNFQAISSADSDNYYGATGRLLMRSAKPSDKGTSISAVGVKKFHCGCKNKFGLNSQGARVAKGRCLGTPIESLGSESDCIALATSKVDSK